MNVEMMIGWWEFLTILLFIFGLCMVIAGAFTAYFGSGKSRTIGGVLLIVGLVVGILWFWLTWKTDNGIYTVDVNLQGLLFGSILILVATIIGALAAVGLFLLAIMKS